MTPRARRLWLWLALLAAVLLGVYSYLGVVMAGTFSRSRTAMYIYLALTVLSVATAATAGILLWRRRVRE